MTLGELIALPCFWWKLGTFAFGFLFLLAVVALRGAQRKIKEQEETVEWAIRRGYLKSTL
jgi:hypothetical protein